MLTLYEIDLTYRDRIRINELSQTSKKKRGGLLTLKLIPAAAAAAAAAAASRLVAAGRLGTSTSSPLLVAFYK